MWLPTRYRLVQKRLKEILVHNPEINTNQAITNIDEDIIQKICYQALEEFPKFKIFQKQKLWLLKSFIHLILKAMSYSMGEVIVQKKNAKAPTTARSRVKAKQLQEANNSSSTPTGHSTSKGNQAGAEVEAEVEVETGVLGAGSVWITHNNADDDDNNSNANTNANTDLDTMDTSFQGVVLSKAPIDMNGDEVGDLTHDLSSMAIDPLEADETEGGMENLLGSINDPQAVSMPLPACISQQPTGQAVTPYKVPSMMPTTTSACPMTSVSALAASLQPKLKCPKPKFANPMALADCATNLPTLTLQAAMPSPALPLSQLPPDEATTTTRAHILLTNIASELTKLQTLTASLGDTQCAAMPLAFLQSLATFATLSSGSTPTKPSASNPGIDYTLYNDDSELSSPKSASESNPPLINHRPNPSSTQPQVQGGLKTQHNMKTPAMPKVMLPSPDNSAESISENTV
ncbi:hypothetical protein FRC11_012960 [Ceratobasidium sp. 423]|nr:hypothetical protein FRC11_012960 [Ceratobasidium sp. 423]